jgi:hypothetical protein
MKKQRIQLVKVAGYHLNHFYALVNVEQEFEEWQGHIFKWQEGQWTLIYTERERDSSGTGFAIGPDGLLLLTTNRGRLVLLNARDMEAIDMKESRLIIHPLQRTSFILGGERAHIFDPTTRSIKTINDKKVGWAGAHTNKSTYLVGMKGDIAEVKEDRLEFIPSPTRQNLMSICSYPDGRLIIGGWGGVVQRQVGDTWEDISLPIPAIVTGLTFHDSKLWVCATGGIYAFNDTQQDWECAVPPLGVSAFAWIGQELITCHTASGLISVYQDGTWIKPFPPIDVDAILQARL